MKGLVHFRDRRLARRMLAGQQPAFEEFFDGYFPGIYRFALTRLQRDEAAAEEVAQATLCAALRKLATYRGEAALYTWLCTFCRHEISAYLRRNRLSARSVSLVEDAPDVRAALESLGGAGTDPAAAFEREELSRLVQVVLDQLPPHYGNALEWKYLEGASVKDIASRLGVSPKAAESTLTRAREAFRDGFTAMVPPRAMENPS